MTDLTDRIGRLRDVLATIGADAAIITHPTNRRYFSSFPAGDHAPDESSGILLVTSDAAILYTSPTNLPWATNSTRADVGAEPWQRPWQEFIGSQLQQRGLARVAFEDLAITVADHAVIDKAAGRVKLVPAGAAFHLLRAAKDEDELEAIRKAARITDAAFVAVTTDMQPGMTERDLVWQIELAMRELGADGPGFPVIVASGPHAARPHHEPSHRVLGNGVPIVIDMGAAVDGYCADLTRTVFIGKAPPQLQERYTMVLSAQQLALATVRAGMSGQEADAIAREAVTAAGYGQEFVHGLGHGVGLLVHEFPSLGATSTDTLQPGHVITIEPGIYDERWGGIRIEDLCVVTPDGLDVLSAAPK
jgi:Xaa-Pro aminopeptidase